MESGVGGAEQRTEPGASFMVVLCSSRDRWCVALAGASSGVSGTLSLCGCHELFVMAWWKSTCARITLAAIFWHCHLVKFFECTVVTQVLVTAQLLQAGPEVLPISNSVLVERQICKSVLDPAMLSITNPCGLEKCLSVSKVRVHLFASM